MGSPSIMWFMYSLDSKDTHSFFPYLQISPVLCIYYTLFSCIYLDLFNPINTPTFSDVLHAFEHYPSSVFYFLLKRVTNSYNHFYCFSIKNLLSDHPYKKNIFLQILFTIKSETCNVLHYNMKILDEE